MCPIVAQALEGSLCAGRRGRLAGDAAKPSIVRYDAWRAARGHSPSAAVARSLATSWGELLADAYPLVYGADIGRASSKDLSR
jgi:hypothetical protein